MKKFTSVLAFAFFSLPLFATIEAPKGFEDPKLLAKVMSGEIVSETLIDTKTEHQTIVRAYFNRVSSDAYIRLATNHHKYPSMFPEVKGVPKSVKINENEFEYTLDVLIQTGPFSFHVYPDFLQVVTPAPDLVSESAIANDVTNYTDVLEFFRQRTRLIPWETGILVEDNLHAKIKKEYIQAAAVKKQILQTFLRYTETLRKELSGNY